MQDVLFLRSDDLLNIAPFDDYIDAVRDGYRQFGAGGQTEAPTNLFHPHQGGKLMYYGALLPETGVMGTFNYTGEFEGHGSWFFTFLADADTGEPLALVDSPSINPYKTGATGAVGVDALARGDASVVGVIGTGPQARAQLLATERVRDLSEVRAYSPTAGNRREFAAEMDQRLDASVRAEKTPNVAVSDADIVITATRATEPVVDSEAIAPGTHITAMGQSHPERRELDKETIERAVYVPDHAERALLASGELLGAIRAGAVDETHVHGDLGAVLAGDVPGRTGPEDVTVFDSGGTGIETIAATHRTFEKAKAAGRGVELSMTPGRCAFPEL